VLGYRVFPPLEELLVHRLRLAFLQVEQDHLFGEVRLHVVDLRRDRLVVHLRRRHLIALEHGIHKLADALTRSARSLHLEAFKVEAHLLKRLANVSRRATLETQLR